MFRILLIRLLCRTIGRVAIAKAKNVSLSIDTDQKILRGIRHKTTFLVTQ